MTPKTTRVYHRLPYHSTISMSGSLDQVRDGPAPRPPNHQHYPPQNHSHSQSSPSSRGDTMTKKLLRAKRPTKTSPSSGPPSLQTTASSSIIPLPKSHIHRTPSELQLADDMRRAEYDDVRMYARLVVGMQSQIQRECLENGGVVHPLSQKSLQGVVKTKQANDEELMTMHDHQHTHHSHHSDPGGWGFGCIEEQDENAAEEMMASPPSSQGGGVGHSASFDAPSSKKSFLTSTCDDQDGDDCVFNLEL
mmetsp:Transcript_14086/g.21165  ORF Transcript_14086/g.21165 Transcript_14086/m.21165 type:complete len:249 (-) Transcript_14086:310-1056(-)